MEGPGKRLRDGRLVPGTLVKTPTGEHARVLPYDTDLLAQCDDRVFVQPLCRPERPWQRWSSHDLTAIPDER